MASYLETAVEIARESGALIADFFARHIPYETKGESDLVTEADRASERLIVERLTRRFPSHAIVAEEGGGHENSSGYRWYVDPLDGTTNFAHSFPCFNVTMALEQQGELVAGVIFDPIRNELFTAELGSGAFLNDNRIHVSKAEKLADTLVATGFPSRKRHQSINIHFYHQMGMLTHGVRRCGSAAIDLAYVACGRLDAFWEFGLNAWDMAAGRLLVAEAGGKYSGMHGEPHQLRGPDLVVDNGLVHDEILALFADIFRGEYRVPIAQL